MIEGGTRGSDFLTSRVQCETTLAISCFHDACCCDFMGHQGSLMAPCISLPQDLPQTSPAGLTTVTSGSPSGPTPGLRASLAIADVGFLQTAEAGLTCSITSP